MKKNKVQPQTKAHSFSYTIIQIRVAEREKLHFLFLF